MLPETGITACVIYCLHSWPCFVPAVLLVNSGLFHIHTYTYSNLSVFFFKTNSPMLIKTPIS